MLRNFICKSKSPAIAQVECANQKVLMMAMHWSSDCKCRFAALRGICTSRKIAATVFTSLAQFNMEPYYQIRRMYCLVGERCNRFYFVADKIETVTVQFEEARFEGQESHSKKGKWEKPEELRVIPLVSHALTYSKMFSWFSKTGKLNSFQIKKGMILCLHELKT